jgi:hypothetical protein
VDLVGVRGIQADPDGSPGEQGGRYLAGGGAGVYLVGKPRRDEVDWVGLRGWVARGEGSAEGLGFARDGAGGG